MFAACSGVAMMVAEQPLNSVLRLRRPRPRRVGSVLVGPQERDCGTALMASSAPHHLPAGNRAMLDAVTSGRSS